MTSPLYLSPLLRWDGLHLVVNFEMVERYLRTYVSRLENLRELHLEGEGDAIRVRATVKYRFLTTRLAFDIAEIRLKRRHFGFRLRRPRVMGGGPLPRRAVLKALKMIGLEEVTVLGGDGIVIVDLGQWLPEQLFFDVRTVQATERFLHIWLGPGAIHDLPPGTIPSLAAGD